MLINVNIYKDCCGILDSHQIILKIQASLCALKSESECEYLKKVLKPEHFSYLSYHQNESMPSWLKKKKKKNPALKVTYNTWAYIIKVAFVTNL